MGLVETSVDLYEGRDSGEQTLVKVFQRDVEDGQEGEDLRRVRALMTDDDRFECGIDANEPILDIGTISSGRDGYVGRSAFTIWTTSPLACDRWVAIAGTCVECVWLEGGDFKRV